MYLTILRAAFLMGQYADFATWSQMDPAREMNPVIVLLGPTLSVICKVVLVALTMEWSYRHPNVMAGAILAFGSVVGFYGAYTNL